MFKPSSIKPDEELRDYLKNRITVGLAGGGSKKVTVYGDWEKPTNEVPDDFIVIYMNGSVGGFGMNIDFARGYLMVSLYCKLNDDGSVKKNRVSKILNQFDQLVEGRVTTHYHYRYDSDRFITPTSPNVTSGYSVTTLNLKWHTINNNNNNNS